MPVVSGPQMVQGLRILRPELQVLYVSGYTDAFGPHLERLGPNARYLAKPFAISSLLAEISELLTQSTRAPIEPGHAPAAR